MIHASEAAIAVQTTPQQRKMYSGLEAGLFQHGVPPTISPDFIRQLQYLLDKYPPNADPDIEEIMDQIVAVLAQNSWLRELDSQTVQALAQKLRAENSLVTRLALIQNNAPSPEAAQAAQLAHIERQQFLAGDRLVALLKSNRWLTKDVGPEDFGIFSTREGYRAALNVLSNGEIGFGIPVLVYHGSKGYDFTGDGEAVDVVCLTFEQLRLLSDSLEEKEEWYQIFPLFLRHAAVGGQWALLPSERQLLFAQDNIRLPVSFRSDSELSNLGYSLRTPEEILELLELFVQARAGNVGQQVLLDLLARSKDLRSWDPFVSKDES